MGDGMVRLVFRWAAQAEAAEEMLDPGIPFTRCRNVLRVSIEDQTAVVEYLDALVAEWLLSDDDAVRAVAEMNRQLEQEASGG